MSNELWKFSNMFGKFCLIINYNKIENKHLNIGGWESEGDDCNGTVLVFVSATLNKNKTFSLYEVI